MQLVYSQINWSGIQFDLNFTFRGYPNFTRFWLHYPNHAITPTVTALSTSGLLSWHSFPCSFKSFQLQPGCGHFWIKIISFTAINNLFPCWRIQNVVDVTINKSYRIPFVGVWIPRLLTFSLSHSSFKRQKQDVVSFSFGGFLPDRGTTVALCFCLSYLFFVPFSLFPGLPLDCLLWVHLISSIDKLTTTF